MEYLKENFKDCMMNSLMNIEEFLELEPVTARMIQVYARRKKSQTIQQ